MTLVPDLVGQLRINFEAPRGRLDGVRPVLIYVGTNLVTRAQALGSPLRSE